MRFLPPVLALALVACASTPERAPYPAAQEVLDAVASRHADLVRLTVHAMPRGSMQLTQVASTMASRRGMPSDPEDLEAMKSGKEVILDEPGGIDVTVPILVEGGSPGAIAGVTLKSSGTADRGALVTRARSIAGELEKAIRTAGRPLW